MACGRLMCRWFSSLSVFVESSYHFISLPDCKDTQYTMMLHTVLFRAHVSLTSVTTHSDDSSFHFSNVVQRIPTQGIEANYFNPTISYWEPLLESTRLRISCFQSDAESFKLEHGLKVLPSKIPYALHVDFEGDVNINISYALLEVTLSTLRMWQDEALTAPRSSDSIIVPFSPYLLRNNSGTC